MGILIEFTNIFSSKAFLFYGGEKKMEKNELSLKPNNTNDFAFAATEAYIKRVIIKFFCLTLICGIVCGLSTSAKALPILSFDVSNTSPLVGDTITVDIVANDVTDLVAFNLDIGFDSSIIGVNTVDPGPFLGSGVFPALSDFTGVIPFDTSTPGEIQNINDSILGHFGVTGSGVLATISFDALNIGTSSLDFLNVNLLAGTELLNSSFLPITISSAPSSSVTPVPEPSTVLLFATGFILLGLTQVYRWRKQKLFFSFRC